MPFRSENAVQHIAYVKLARRDISASKKDPEVNISQIGGAKLVLVWKLGSIESIKALLSLDRARNLFQETGVTVVPVLVSHDPDRPLVQWASAVVYLAQGVQRGASWSSLFPSLTPFYDAQGLVLKSTQFSAYPQLIFLNKNNTVVETYDASKSMISISALKEKLVQISSVS